MVINADGKNDYGLDYLIRAPKFLFINKTYRLKLFFEDGIYLEYAGLNDPGYYDAGTEFEFRTIVYKNEMEKIQSTKSCLLSDWKGLDPTLTYPFKQITRLSYATSQNLCSR